MLLQNGIKEQKRNMISLLESPWGLFVMLPIVTIIMGWALRFPLYKVARCKRLSDVPNVRSSHCGEVPYVGGVLIFATFCSILMVFVPVVFWEWRWGCLAAFLMFALGLYDDILKISPGKKLKGELFAILLVVVCQEVRFTDFGGFWGVYELPMLLSILTTSLFMLLLVNAFNLIDGIDGLCAGVAMSDALFLGVSFIVMGEMVLAVVCLALCASLVPFFVINVFGRRIKMFLGDTGSLTLGLMLGMLVVVHGNQVYSGGSVSMAVAFFALPLLDAMRLFVVRIWHRKSPFAPDRNHIHHKILRLFGNNHLKSTLILLVLNAFFVYWSLLTQSWNIEWVLISTVGWFGVMIAMIEIKTKVELTINN